MTLSRTIPALPVVSIPVAVEFYEGRLGFRARYADDRFAVVARDKAELHLWAACDASWEERGPDDPPVVSGAETFLAGTASCRIQSDDLDALFGEYRARGVLYAPDTTIREQPWGERDLAVLDLHRNLLTFFQPIEPERG